MSGGFSDWGVFAPKDQTGFGRQADDMISVLGVGWRFIAESHHMTSAPASGPREVEVRREDSRERCEEILDWAAGLRGVFFFERLDWNPEFFRACKSRGIRNVCVPNWEWFACDPVARRRWDELVDVFVCPNAMCERVLARYGVRNAVRLPWCLDLEKLPVRRVDGPARVFVHNAGLVDGQDRKGTRDTIRAFMRVRRRDIRLIVRMQRPAELPAHDERVEVRVGNLAEPGLLYEEGDVAVQPSKMEGVGFMVMEPAACGMPTVTLDYPPMNETVRQREMLVRKLPLKRKAIPTVWVRHAHLRLPSVRDLARKIEWCAENDLGWISRENRRFAEETYNREAVRRVWAEALGVEAG